MIPDISIRESALSEDKKLEILNDHYKDSFNHLREFLKTRDKLFFWVLIVVTLMLYQFFLPMEAKDVVGHIIMKALNLDETVDASFMCSIIWFSLLAVVVRYFQTVINIETQYKYIHKLEDQLTLCYENNAFTREGKTYLKDYWKFSKWIKRLYVIIFPLLLLIVIAAKIFNEICASNGLSFLLVFDILVSISIAFFIALYIRAIHFLN
jgi:hypothetical protein